MNTLDLEMKFQAPTEAGEIAGYGAVFGNVDEVGDRLAPGAFAKSLARHQTKGTRPLMLWSHDPREVIGVWDEFEEDAKGLRVKGRLVLETNRGRETHALLKAGAFNGMSMGYRTVKANADGPVRVLQDVDIYEVSLVGFPANGKSRVTQVKSDGDLLSDFARRLRDGEPPEIKEFEDLLREAGIPKSMAVRIASHGYATAIRSESEGKANDTTLSILRDAARALTTRT